MIVFLNLNSSLRRLLLPQGLTSAATAACTSQAISKGAMLLVRRAAMTARGAIAAHVSPRPAFAAHAATARRQRHHTVAAIEDGDDDKWRKLLSDADFLAAVETSDELAAAFVRRMDQQTVEISRLGVPEGNDPEIWTYAAHLFTHEDPAVLATARVAVWRDDGNAMIFQTAAASTAVPQEVLSRVVSTAKTEVENLASCDKIAGVARAARTRQVTGCAPGSARQRPGSASRSPSGAPSRPSPRTRRGPGIVSWERDLRGGEGGLDDARLRVCGPCRGRGGGDF